MRLTFLIVSSLFAVAVGVCACGSAADGEGSSHVLSTHEAKYLLMELPYKYEFRQVKLPEGASGALAGWVANRTNVGINFGISLGRHPAPVAVPQAGTEGAYGYPHGGFVYTDDLQVQGRSGRRIINKRYHSTREWHEASEINVAIQEKLCRAATGKRCPP